MAVSKKTFCRNCGALCPMEVTVEDGRLVSASADGSASPYGAYMCAKGHAAVAFHNGAENRLYTSLRKNADGSFSELPAERAMDEIAARLNELVQRHGPRSVAVYHGTGAYRSVLGGLLERAFVSALGTPNFFSTMTIDQSAKWVTAGRMGVMASGKASFRDIDLAVIAGNNPLVSHQTFPFAAGESGAPGRAYAEARERSMKMIMIDPRRNETARYADLLIQPLPGHDAAIFAAIAHILLRDGTWNREFCDCFVSQMDELREAVAPFTPELAARRADVPVEQIERAAQWLGEARRAFVGSGSGPSMSAHSNVADHMIEVVNALVGGYRRAGDLVRNPGTLNPRRVVEMAIPPTRSWERGVKCHSADVGKLFGEFPTALLPDEIQTPGPDRIRALIVFGGNLAMGLGDPARAVPALEDLDLLVSLDARLNETGELSHYVIGTSQQFERHDISIPGDSLYPEAFAQYAEPVVDKPVGVIHDWEFFWGVAARMQLSLVLKYWTYGLDYDEIPEGMALGVDTPPDPEEMIRFLCRRSAVPFAQLKANPQGVRPALEPSYVAPCPAGSVGRLALCPADVAAELRTVLSDRGQREFAYQLTCRRVLEAMNSAYRDSAQMRRKYPVNWAYMNPYDMVREGLEDGDRIRISAEAGHVLALVRAEDRLRPGIISMTHMFGALAPSTDPLAQKGSYSGRLTSLENCLQPINYMPRFSGVPVSISADSTPEPQGTAAPQ